MQPAAPAALAAHAAHAARPLDRRVVVEYEVDAQVAEGPAE